jgi:Mrp family chromosome partitioning ATPase
LEPIEYVRALIRRWPIIAIAAFIGAAFAFVGTDPEPEPVQTRYTATHTLLVTNTQFGSQSLIGTITFAQVPVFATRGVVPERVADELGYNGAPAALAAQVTVTEDEQTGTLLFTTEQDAPETAVRIADAFADETVSYLQERQEEIRQERQVRSQSDVDELEQLVTELDQQVAAQIAERNADLPEGEQPRQADSVLLARRDAAVREYGVEYEAYRELVTDDTPDLNLTTLERAQPVQTESGGFTAPRTRSTRVPIAAGVGALLGAGLALLVERLDAKLRDRRRAEEAFGHAVVGEIPSFSRKQRAARLVVAPDQHSTVAEAFRSLRTSVTFMAAGGQPLADDDRVGAVLVTSPSPAEGKTTVAVNLAAAFAETGRSVVVVNSDFRRPVASNIIASEERPPLPAGLAGIERLDPTSFLVPTKIPGVQLLDLSPLGGSPGDLTRATVRLVNELVNRVDVVVIDTPPLAVTTEALEFVPASKVVVLIGRIGRTSMTAAQRAGELARFGGAEQIAIAITDTGTSRLRRNHYYSYYGDAAGRSPKRRLWRERNASKGSGGGAEGPGDATGAPPADEDDEWLEIDALVGPGPSARPAEPRDRPAGQPDASDSG